MTQGVVPLCYGLPPIRFVTNSADSPCAARNCSVNSTIIGNSSECRRNGELRMAYGGKHHDMFAFPGAEQPALLPECAARELTEGYGQTAGRVVCWDHRHPREDVT